jgi:hypothetical protein
MRKKKPYKILEERLKNNYIVIELFKRRKTFSLEGVVHTPELAPENLPPQTSCKTLFGSGYGPRQYNKFPIQRRYPGASSWVSLFGLSTSIGYNGTGQPEYGAYPSYFHAKNAALHNALDFHKSPKEQAVLKRFRLLEDLDQPLLFED